jgi:uncharacterized protein (TIGR02001 family)
MKHERGLDMNRGKITAIAISLGLLAAPALAAEESVTTEEESVTTEVQHHHHHPQRPPMAGPEGSVIPWIPGAFSANVAMTTDYVFRGISQSDEAPAVQGGFDYSASLLDQAGPVNGVGMYLGAWASNVDFDDTDAVDTNGDGVADIVDPDGASIEIDYYGGLNWEFAFLPGLGWSVGAVYYDYPGSDGSLQYDYVEADGGLSYDFGLAAASAHVYFSPNYFGANTYEAWYFSGDLEIPLPRTFSLTGHIGRMDIKNSQRYVDWKIGLAAEIFGFGAEIAYYDTDETMTECAATDLCDPRGVFTLSRSF